MHPTFENLDYLIIDELVYNFIAPARGDVVVFRYPRNPFVFYIKTHYRTSEKQFPSVMVSDDNYSRQKKLALTEPYIVNEDATYTDNVSLNPGEYRDGR